MNETHTEDFYDGKTCSAILDAIGKISYDGDCNPTGKEDMLRTIPCTDNQICNNQREEFLIPSYQFTFKVENNTKEM